MQALYIVIQRRIFVMLLVRAGRYNSSNFFTYNSKHLFYKHVFREYFFLRHSYTLLCFFLLEGIHIHLFRNQMLAVMVLSQHRVLTSKTISPRIPVGARCTGHVRMMCCAVCSAAPHSQFDVGARPHLCMND